MELEFLTLKLASSVTGLSERTLRRRVNEGIIPRAKFSPGKILIPSSYFTKQGFNVLSNQEMKGEN